MTFQSTGGGVGLIPIFSVHKNGTAQTGIVTATDTLVTWSTEVLDTNNNFASNAFIPTVPGKYLLIAYVFFNAMGDGVKYGVRIFKNGSGHKQADYSLGGNHNGSAPLISVVEANGVDDDFTIYARQESGSNQVINGTAAITYFEGLKIAE